jgi:hypothetical protein
MSAIPFNIKFEIKILAIFAIAYKWAIGVFI